MDITLTIFLVLSCSSTVSLLDICPSDFIAEKPEKDSCSSNTVFEPDRDIRLPPDIIEGPAVNSALKFGSSLTLPCISTGTDVTFWWDFKNKTLESPITTTKIDKPIVNGLFTDGSLVLKDTSPRDLGSYRCFANNSFGTTMSNWTNVREAQFNAIGLTAELPDITLPDNNNKYFVFLHCKRPSASVPNATTFWIFFVNEEDPPKKLNNTERIMVNLTGSLWISYFEKADNGKYCCVEYNEVINLRNTGRCTRVFLNRPDPGNFAPQISTDVSTPAKTSVPLGYNLTIQCLFSGKPAPNIYWKMPDNATNNWRFADFNRSLISKEGVYFSDIGTYECVGYNDVDSATYSIELNVTVGETPAFGSFCDKPHSRSVIEGDPNATIYCKAESDPEVISTKWYINTKEYNVSEYPNMEMLNDNKTLIINNPNSSMSIQCEASNGNKSVFAQGYFNILIRTRISRVPSYDQPFESSKDMYFQCNVTYDDSTSLNVTWTFNNSTLDQVEQSGVYEIYSNHTLHIITSGDSDRGVGSVGEYKCSVTNGHSCDFIIYNLYKKPGPRFEWWECLLATLGIILFILLILLILLIFRKYRQGESYPVDKNERKNGNDPVNDLKDADFHHATNVSNDTDNLISPNVMSGYGDDERDFSYPAYHDEVSNYPYNPHEANGFKYDPMNEEGNDKGSIVSNGNPYSSVGKLNNQVTLV